MITECRICIMNDNRKIEFENYTQLAEHTIDKHRINAIEMLIVMFVNNTD